MVVNHALGVTDAPFQNRLFYLEPAVRLGPFVQPIGDVIIDPGTIYSLNLSNFP